MSAVDWRVVAEWVQVILLVLILFRINRAVAQIVGDSRANAAAIIKDVAAIKDGNYWD